MSQLIAPAGKVSGAESRNLILAAMIFAVSMTFIDQTIVSIAAPQHPAGARPDEHRRAVGGQRLPAVARRALRLRRPAGRHRRPPRMVVLGVIVFAGASALCGLTPKGSLAEAWIVTFRGAAGRRRGDHVPGRAGDRRPDLRAARARQGAGAVLRHRRRADRGRPDPRRLPHAVDVAGDLLGQHPGRDHRAGADRDLEAGHRVPRRPGWTTAGSC